MSEYLSKEEVKQWRSSLEKITLEDFAARLGKKIEESKPTRDLIDIVLKGQPVVSNEAKYSAKRAEKLNAIAENAFALEQKIAPSAFTINKIIEEKIKEKDLTKTKEAPAKKVATKKITQVCPAISKSAPKSKAKKATKAVKEEKQDTLQAEINYIFKKALTDREKKVFEHFTQNKGEVVYAKDLATILDLPRDYVYKYIKN